MLGFLGMVSGMIEIFRMMMVFGLSDFEVIFGGIVKVLVMIELGLVVVILVLILNVVFFCKVWYYYEEFESFVFVFSNDEFDVVEKSD